MSLGLPEKFEKTVKDSGLIFPGGTIFVACSGGPDSTGLFHLLFLLRKPLNLRLGLIHFNHGLRPKFAKLDELFVRALAKQYKVPFYCGSGKVNALAKKEKYSQEEAARLARYDFFKKIAMKYKIKTIATAHTLDDQAETVLMRIFQGTGLRGLCGIRSSLRFGKLTFVRPLLNFSKKEILEFLKENQFRFCIDASNISERYLRNRIRIKLIPWLVKEFHPKIMETVARVPAILAEDAALFDQMESHAWKRIFLSRKKEMICLRRGRFLKLAPSLQFRMIDQALRLLNPKSGLSFEAWGQLRQLLLKSSARQSLPKDIDFSLTPSKLMLYKK